MQTVRRSIWPLVAVMCLSLLAFDVLGSSSTASAPTTALPYGNLRIQYLPDPNDIVNLAEGTPYTVPAGKVLIITDWVTTNVQTLQTDSAEYLRIHPNVVVDGVKVWGGGFAVSRVTPAGGNWAPIPVGTTGTNTLSGSLRSGIRADAGQVVSLTTNVFANGGSVTTPKTFASGYLAKAN